MEAPSPTARQRDPLTRERILDAAVRLIDDEGLGAVTMRRLANDLGVGTMSLYTYVPNKEELLDAVLEVVGSEIRLPLLDPADPLQSIRELLREFRRVANLHPNLVPLVNSRPPATAESLRPLEAGFDAFRQAGLDAREAVQAYRLLVSYAIGFISLETGGFFRDSADAASRAVPPDQGVLEQFPRVAEAAPHLFDWDADAEFENGIDAFLAHLRSRISGRARPLRG